MIAYLVALLVILLLTLCCLGAICFVRRKKITAEKTITAVQLAPTKSFGVVVSGSAEGVRLWNKSGGGHVDFGAHGILCTYCLYVSLCAVR